MKRQKTLLRHLRRSLDLSIDEVAHTTGVDPSRLSRGERRLIPLNEDHLAALAKFYTKKCKREITPEQLMAEPDLSGVAA